MHTSLGLSGPSLILWMITTSTVILLVIGPPASAYMCTPRRQQLMSQQLNHNRTTTHTTCAQQRQQLALLPQEYVQKLGTCLLDAKEDDTDPSTANMNKWAAEATSLMVCMALRNPWAVRAFNAAVDASSSPGKTCAGQWKSSHLLVCSSMSSGVFVMCACGVCAKPPE